MDKETLSNYGWVVIVIIVLVIMIALASPFGSYIRTSVASATSSLTNVVEKNSKGMINMHGDELLNKVFPDLKENTLKIKDTAPAIPIIDKNNNCGYTGSIYGIDTIGYDDGFAKYNENPYVENPYPKLNDFFTTALGDEYLKVTLTANELGCASTGATVEVLGKDKTTVLEKYVFIYFGDVGGNALIDLDDVMNIKNKIMENSSAGNSLYKIMAADVNGDGIVTIDDAMKIKEYNDTGFLYIEKQNEFGSKAVLNTYTKESIIKK